MKILRWFLLLPIVIGLIYFSIHFLLYQEIAENTAPFMPFMEAQGLVVKGWDYEVPAWMLRVNTADLTDRNQGELFGVYDGWILGDRGGRIVRDISANHGIVNLSKKEIILEEVTGFSNPISMFKNDLAFTADSIQAGVESLNLFNLVARDKDSEIKAGVVVFEKESKALVLKDQVSLSKKGMVLKSEILTLEVNQLASASTVNLKYQFESGVKKDYWINILAGKMRYKDLKNKEFQADFSNNFSMKVKDIIILSDKAFYSSIEDILTIKDNAKITFIAIGEFLSTNNLDIPDGSSVSAREIILDFNNEKIFLTNQIIFIKGSTQIKADKGVYDFKKGKLEIFNNVQIVENKKMVRAERVLIDLKNNSVEAFGKVASQIQI